MRAERVKVDEGVKVALLHQNALLKICQTSVKHSLLNAGGKMPKMA